MEPIHDDADRVCTCTLCIWTTVHGVNDAIIGELLDQIYDPALCLAKELVKPFLALNKSDEWKMRMIERAADDIAIDLISRN